MTIIHPLTARELPEIVEHLQALSGEDRRLRFGGPTSNETIGRYVTRIDFSQDAVFGARNPESLLVGLTHVAHLEDSVELGLSVLESERGRGIAQAMFHRALLHARNRGIGELYMHCLSENSPMLHISRKAGMRIVTDGPERDAYLALPQSTFVSLGQELREGQMALFDWALSKASRQARKSLLALA